MAHDQDGPEDKPQSSGLVTGKELRYLLFGFGGIFLLLIPVFFMLRENPYEVICRQNMKAISSAIGSYAELDDGYYPLPYYMDQTGSPVIQDGKAVTWVSLLEPHMNPRKNFVCPSAKDDENVTNFSFKDKSAGIKSSYGLVVGTISALRNGLMLPIRTDDVADPDNVILIAETSNRGSQDTYNPVPFIGSGAEPAPWDGFLVAYELDNFVPDLFTPGNPDPEKSEFATRLAFYGTGDGKFDDQATSRHKKQMNAVTATGSGAMLGPPSALIKRIGDEPSGAWWPKNNRIEPRKR